MREAMPPLPQYASMAWCSVKKAQGQLVLLYITLLRDIGLEVVDWIHLAYDRFDKWRRIS
jgi:hypothetical protein